MLSHTDPKDQANIVVVLRLITCSATIGNYVLHFSNLQQTFRWYLPKMKESSPI